MYTDRNFKTKKALKEFVANGGKVGVYQPNNFFNVQPKPNSTVTLEGPHFPEAHKWYAQATLDADCNVVKVK
jgi:hypothetical protein